MEQFIGIIGIFVFLFLAWLISCDWRSINIRLFFWTVLFLVVFGQFVFRSELGHNTFSAVNNVVIAMVDAALEGPKFVFGSLADPAASEKSGVGFVLFFQGLVTVIVISALLSILYYIGLMSWILKLFAAVFSRLTGISGAESLAACANIFVGNESMLSIRPCMSKLTRSEIGVLLTTCMATISANIIGLYVGALRDVFPSIAGHLVSASVLSVPAAVLLAKLAMPERDTPETLGIHVEPHYEREGSLVEAVLGGGETGFKMVVGISTMLIAVVGLLAIVNSLLGWCGNQINPILGSSVVWSIQEFFSFIFYPFVWLMGVPYSDVPEVASLVGTRVIATEVPAYFSLAELLRTQAIEPRSAVIAAYALCGFAHIPSLAIFVGAATALAPERRTDIAAMAWKSLFAATLACFLTGAVAGLFFSGNATIL